MVEPIINQAWEDVADDVTGAIEKAVQPLLKKAVDDIYGGLLDATQDYLKENLAFNIASRISTAEREARDARDRSRRLLEALETLDAAGRTAWHFQHSDTNAQLGFANALAAARAAIALARTEPTS